MPESDMVGMCLVVTTAFVSMADMQGGAARAAFRLHQGMLSHGADSIMLVQDKYSDSDRVFMRQGKLSRLISPLRPALELRIFKYWYGGSSGYYSTGMLPFSSIPGLLSRNHHDIVHLHWINGGALSIRDIGRLGCPVVWTLHDMWAFTGGCHYDENCGRFQRGCGDCPQLNRSGQYDLSRGILNKKREQWKDLDLTIVTPSKWLANCAQQSILFSETPIEVIPNGLDLDIFKPVDKVSARNILNLPVDRKYVLFGSLNAAEDKRKGFDLLQGAMHTLRKNSSHDIECLVFGASERRDKPDFGFPVRYLGMFHDDISLAILYSAADVMVVPSRQDNLPNSIEESLACATPVVAFDTGGMPDLIDHKKNGYLANAFNVEDLAAGIQWTIEDESRLAQLSSAARKTAENKFSLPDIVEKYLAVYEAILNKS